MARRDTALNDRRGREEWPWLTSVRRPRVTKRGCAATSASSGRGSRHGSTRLMAEDAFTFSAGHVLQVDGAVAGAVRTAGCRSAGPRRGRSSHREFRDLARHGDGRLGMGHQRLDEAYPLPYTSDLVRLAASALLAIKSDRLAIGPRAACNAILAGYRVGLARGGRPFVLAERHRWLGDIARRELKDAKGFWKRIEEPDLAREGIPETVKKTLESTLPDPDLPLPRVAANGRVGSLGCPRYLAVAHWRGGMIAREAKAMPPSAHVWAGGTDEPPAMHAKRIAESAVGARATPSAAVRARVAVRRLAPDCCKLDLGDLPGQRDEQRLLRAMGKETANAHCGSADSLPAVARTSRWAGPGLALQQPPEPWPRPVREEWKEWRALQKNRS